MVKLRTHTHTSVVAGGWSKRWETSFQRDSSSRYMCGCVSNPRQRKFTTQYEEKPQHNALHCTALQLWNHSLIHDLFICYSVQLVVIFFPSLSLSRHYPFGFLLIFSPLDPHFLPSTYYFRWCRHFFFLGKTKVHLKAKKKSMRRQKTNK